MRISDWSSDVCSSDLQAVKALKDEGYRVIRVNSNPATIMTDPEFADATYIEPILPEVVTRILERERPDAILPTMGGQTALNTCLPLARAGTIDRLGSQMIRARADDLEKAADRLPLREPLHPRGLDSPRPMLVRNRPEAAAAP